MDLYIAFAELNSLYQYNSAGHEGGGLLKAFWEDTDLSYCTPVYAVTFVQNYADSVGSAMYVSLHVDTDIR